MSMIITSIEVDVPVSIAFQEWIRFEERPRKSWSVSEPILAPPGGVSVWTGR